jgi:hypothetical protein
MTQVWEKIVVPEIPKPKTQNNKPKTLNKFQHIIPHLQLINDIFTNLSAYAQNI